MELTPKEKVGVKDKRKKVHYTFLPENAPKAFSHDTVDYITKCQRINNTNT